MLEKWCPFRGDMCRASNCMFRTEDTCYFAELCKVLLKMFGGVQ